MTLIGFLPSLIFFWHSRTFLAWALVASSRILLTETESLTSVNSKADFSSESTGFSLPERMQFCCLEISGTFGVKQTKSSQSATRTFALTSSRVKNSIDLIFFYTSILANSSWLSYLLLSLYALFSCLCRSLLTESVPIMLLRRILSAYAAMVERSSDYEIWRLFFSRSTSCSSGVKPESSRSNCIAITYF